MKILTSIYFKISLLGLIILGILIVHLLLPRVITEIRNPVMEFAKGKHLITTAPSYNTKNHKIGRRIEFHGIDSAKLVAFETYSKTDTVLGTVMLLHGIRSKKEHYIDFSNLLAMEGFNAIALDLRAHGESSGKHCTFGVLEKEDVSILINKLRKENNDLKIGVFGQSLGGAVALQALEIDQRLSFGIVESTFSDFRTITQDYINYTLGIKSKPFSNYLITRSGKIADFNPDLASPIKSCENITQPVLMVHGDLDERIDIKYGKANFLKLNNTNSKFIEIAGANHLNVWKVGGLNYQKSIIEYIKLYCK